MKTQSLNGLSLLDIHSLISAVELKNTALAVKAKAPLSKIVDQESFITAINEEMARNQVLLTKLFALMHKVDDLERTEFANQRA